MPVQKCRIKDKSGWKWGEDGACYTYTPGDEKSSNRAKRKAHIQGAAIEAAKARAGK